MTVVNRVPVVQVQTCSDEPRYVRRVSEDCRYVPGARDSRCIVRDVRNHGRGGAYGTGIWGRPK